MSRVLPANLLQAPPTNRSNQLLQAPPASSINQLRQFRSASPPRARNHSHSQHQMLIGRPLVFTTPTTLGGAQRNWLKEASQHNEALATLLKAGAPNLQQISGNNDKNEKKKSYQQEVQKVQYLVNRIFRGIYILRFIQMSNGLKELNCH